MANRSYRDSVIPPIGASLKEISELGEDQYNELRQSIEGNEGFDVSLERCERLANKLGHEDPSSAFRLLGTLRYLYFRLDEWTEKSDENTAVLRDFLRSTGIWSSFGEKAEESFTRLLSLLKRNTAEENRKKIDWLRTGIIDTAIGFSSFLDLRPDFSIDRTRIERIIPTLIFRVSTESDRGDEKSHAFQLTVDGLKKLREAVDDLSKKLDCALNEKRLSDLKIVRDGKSDG